jgi:hypothetical protein
MMDGQSGGMDKPPPKDITAFKRKIVFDTEQRIDGQDFVFGNDEDNHKVLRHWDNRVLGMYYNAPNYGQQVECFVARETLPSPNKGEVSTVARYAVFLENLSPEFFDAQGEIVVPTDRTHRARFLQEIRRASLLAAQQDKLAVAAQSATSVPEAPSFHIPASLEEAAGRVRQEEKIAQVPRPRTESTIRPPQLEGLRTATVRVMGARPDELFGHSAKYDRSEVIRNYHTMRERINYVDPDDFRRLDANAELKRRVEFQLERLRRPYQTFLRSQMENLIVQLKDKSITASEVHGGLADEISRIGRDTYNLVRAPNRSIWEYKPGMTVVDVRAMLATKIRAINVDTDDLVRMGITQPAQIDLVKAVVTEYASYMMERAQEFIREERLSAGTVPRNPQPGA